MPPVVKAADPLPDQAEAILIGPAGQPVYVLAEDEEDDEVRFTWSLSNEGIVGRGYPVSDGLGSQIDLAYDPELDGQTLRCFLDDGENDYVTLTWHLEVL
ncbi:MAG: hypothetical protein Q8P41_01840 [Pseudomonadota bacterium]|nr:hypothetical protein [Pseudomonadota bacterium]